MNHPNKEFMEAAISEASRVRALGDYAIGAVIVKDDQIIGRGGNSTKLLKSPIWHAEVVAVNEASKALGTRDLTGCIMYTTHEPCPMCAGAGVWARLDGIVYGANIEDMNEFAKKNNDSNFQWRTIDIHARQIIDKSPNKPFLIEDFMREECNQLFHVS